MIKINHRDLRIRLGSRTQRRRDTKIVESIIKKRAKKRAPHPRVLVEKMIRQILRGEIKA